MYYENIFGFFNFDWLYKQQIERVTDEAHFVEIGGFLGKSSCFMAESIVQSGKDITFDVIDTWEGSDEQIFIRDLVKEKGCLFNVFIENIKLEKVDNIINPFRRDSNEASKMYADKSLDFVYLDGDHSYEYLIKEIPAWLPKVKKDGIIAGHDYDGKFKGVRKAVNEIFIGKRLKSKNKSWIHHKGD